MFIIRDIFQLQFGHYKDVKVLLDEAFSTGLMPETKSKRVLTDFTGDAYRLIFELGFDTLADYENSMTGGMSNPDWQKWYERFKPHISSSHREILKQVM